MSTSKKGHLQSGSADLDPLLSPQELIGLLFSTTFRAIRDLFFIGIHEGYFSLEGLSQVSSGVGFSHTVMPGDVEYLIQAAAANYS
jgi:hypothetical protein